MKPESRIQPVFISLGMMLIILSGCQPSINTNSSSGATASGSGQVTEPQISPPGLTTNVLAIVKITDATSHASIRYTTDGSTPSETAGILYTAPITNIASCTIRAIAYSQGLTDSLIASASFTINPAIADFNIALSQGDFWEYEWSNSTSVFAEGGSSYTKAGGTGTVTLGSPVTIQGIQAFPLIFSGTFPSQANPTNWKYIAINNSRIFGSQDGATWQDIFNAATGANSGGGFFWPDPTNQITVAKSASIQTPFYTNSHAYLLAGASSTGGSVYVPDYGWVPSGQTSTSLSHSEYFAPGIGPVGLTYFSSYSGYEFSSSTTLNMGLRASSFASQ